MRIRGRDIWQAIDSTWKFCSNWFQVNKRIRIGFKSTKGYMKQCQINHRHKALAYALTSLLLDAAHDDEATLLEDGRCCIWFSA